MARHNSYENFGSTLTERVLIAMLLILKRISCAVAIGASMLSVASQAVAGDSSNTLNIYNWSNYIAPDTIKNFEKATGIKVRYDTFDSNETLQAKLMVGHSGYDLVVPGSSFAPLQIEGGLLQKLDKTQIPNWNNQDPGALKKLAAVDPGNDYLVEWRWSYFTVGINKEAVTKALGNTPMPTNAWSLVYDPKYAKLVSKCGIEFTDSAYDNIPAALMYLGYKPDSTNPSDYRAVTKMLLNIRAYVTKISTVGWVDDLQSDNTCVAVTYSGDINIAKDRAIQNKSKFTIQALIPSSGAVLFFDTMAIPKDAKHVDNALKFINYVLDPKVSASITNAVFYPGPVPASIKYTKKSIADDPSVFLSAADLDKMHAPIVLTNKIRALETRAWNDFKIGIQ